MSHAGAKYGQRKEVSKVWTAINYKGGEDDHEPDKETETCLLYKKCKRQCSVMSVYFLPLFWAPKMEYLMQMMMATEREKERKMGLAMPRILETPMEMLLARRMKDGRQE